MDLWEMDIRRFGAQYRSPSLHATPGSRRPTRPTTTSAIRTTSARPAGRCGSRPPTPGTREHGAAFGEKSGWERVNWYESNAAAGDESPAPRGWAGQHWSPAIGAEHRGDARGGRAVRRDVVREDRGRGPRRGRRSLETLCDNRVAREVGQDHLHADAQLARRDRVRLHRHPARRGPLLDRHRHGVRQPRPRRGSARTCPADGSVQRRATTTVALGVLRPVGAAGPRDPRSR